MAHPKFIIGYLLTLLSLYSNPSIGQSKGYLDSLELTLDTIKQPLKKAETLNKLAAIYARIDLDKAIIFSKKSIPFVPKDNFQDQGNVYNTLGILHHHKDKPTQALNYLDTAIFFYEKAQYKKGLALIHGNLGAFNAQREEYTKGLEHIYKSIALYEELNNQEGIAQNLVSLISINFAQKEFSKSLENARKALAIRLQIKRRLDKNLKEKKGNSIPYSIHENKFNIAMIYFNMASSFVELRNVDSTIFYYDQSLLYYKEINNKEGVAYVYEGLGLFYKRMNQPNLALNYIEKALELEQHINSETRKIILQNSLASIYQKNKLYAKSIQYHTLALDAANKSGMKSYQKDALDGLALCHEALGNYKDAYFYEKQFAIVKDSLLNETKQKQIKDLEIKYETQKKEQTNIVLTQERDIEKLKSKRSQLLTYALIVILILVLIASYFFLRSNKIQTLQQTTKLKHQLLRNQMSPHFIFNALIAIQSFMYKNDGKEAGKYLSSFARLVRAILENSRNEYITLEKEVQWLENYLKLQLLRFDGKFDYDIILDVDVDTYSILIPPMLTQPFIENALEHGLKSIDYQGKLEVFFKIEGELLNIEVRDNGIGVDKAKASKGSSKHMSLATAITTERLSFLNKKRSSHIHFTIKPLDLGTSTMFSIPIKYI